MWLELFALVGLQREGAQPQVACGLPHSTLTALHPFKCPFLKQKLMVHSVRIYAAADSSHLTILKLHAMHLLAMGGGQLARVIPDTGHLQEPDKLFGRVLFSPVAASRTYC
jgi:hypothetical protein